MRTRSSFELKALSSLHGLAEKVLLARKNCSPVRPRPTHLPACPLPAAYVDLCVFVCCRLLARTELRARRHVEHGRTSKLSRSSSTRPQASLRLEVCSRRTVCSRPPCVYAAARMPIHFRHELPALAQVQVARGSAGAKNSRQNQEPHKRSRRNGRERTRGASIALLCLIDRWSRERAWNSHVLSHICRYR